ncbi:hypothetical protein F3Y22_tig00113722pilonHSYRG00260 [Hibiscus syriacus]|uniref:DUF4218 domain-containing protein n=1 Tax=Hibiscus syriacus TaxID=106335 RepID=A0A6A2X0W5_HIBSY|nr:hypothetical protein F3Y22_tig00113722pilonHSYRG00260 [Hibiscus syriacus]
MFSSPEMAQNVTWHAQGRANNGPKQHGNNIDVYLAPLIADLKLFWETGVKTYDAYKKEYCNLRAILLWTINYFHAYGNLSGCVTKGEEIYDYLTGFETSWGVLHVKVRKTIIEKYFPPSFFDVMIHLMVHLVRDVRLCGPVHFRMLFGRGSLGILLRLLKNMKSIGNPHERVDERIRTGKPLSRGTIKVVDAKLLDEAHLYVLRNTADVDPYIKQHMLKLKDHNPRASRNSKWLQTQHSRTFISWLKTKVDTHFANEEDICESVRWLAKGPSFAVKKYISFAINEYQFHTTSRDESRTTQCSGVSLVAHAMQIASAKDSNPVQAKKVFYVQDQQDVNLSVVGFTPYKMYKYGANGETDDMLEYHVVLGTMESDQSSSHDEDSKQRGLTIKGKTTKGKVIVTYNKKGVPIGIEVTKLASFEGMVARSMVPITYATWRDVEQEQKEDLWQNILEISQKAKKMRGQHRYNHRLSRKGYAGLTL